MHSGALFFFFNDTATTEIYTLSLHDALPIFPGKQLEKSIPQTMKILGQVFQEEGKAKEVSDFIEKQYSLIASKKLQERTKKPTVYYEKSGYSEVVGSTATSKTGWGMVIKIAGGENIADKLLIDRK